MNDDGSFSLISESSHCEGLKEREIWRLGEWLVEQGIVPFDEMNLAFSEITIPLKTQELDIENPNINKMVFMSLYNLDKFKEFILKSSFLDRFEIDSLRIEKIKRDDLELLKFAFDWIHFGIFGKKVFTVKENPEKPASS
ncbi:hypothetical protein ACFL9T_20195 [Thermodesulfobacteriota bacterium]